jgi:putative restriction endonuclease
LIWAIDGRFGKLDAVRVRTLTTTGALLQQFRSLNVWRRRYERAPHKPLLVLYAPGKLQGGAERLIPFDLAERPLAQLLQQFGPPRKLPHPELPLYHLRNDGGWEIDEEVPLKRWKGSDNPLLGELRKHRTGGGFTEDIYADLKRRQELVRELARAVAGRIHTSSNRTTREQTARSCS